MGCTCCESGSSQLRAAAGEELGARAVHSSLMEAAAAVHLSLMEAAAAVHLSLKEAVAAVHRHLLCPLIVHNILLA